MLKVKIFDQRKNMWQWTTCQVMSAGNDDISFLKMLMNKITVLLTFTLASIIFINDLEHLYLD